MHDQREDGASVNTAIIRRSFRTFYLNRFLPGPSFIRCRPPVNSPLGRLQEAYLIKYGIYEP